MQEEAVPLQVGEMLVVLYQDFQHEENFLEGADDRERVKSMINSFT